MKTIQVQGKVYLAKVKGPSAKYGVEAEFLKPSLTISNRLAEFEVGPGVYKHEPRMVTCDSMRRDTGYLHITEDGKTREITQAEAITLAEAATIAESPDVAKVAAIARIRDLMHLHGITFADIEAARNAAQSQ